MERVTKNKVVTFSYVLRDKASGEEIDRSDSFTVLFGAGRLIEGLESRMEGMCVGEQKTFEIPAEEAYGERDEQLVQQVPREYFGDIALEKGMMLRIEPPNSPPMDVIIADFDETFVTMDFNHPLAGRDLICEVVVLNIREATDEERQQGFATEL